MRFHRNAKLGLAGRRELVLRIASGCSIREAATIFNVSSATAHRWWRSWRDPSSSERGKPSYLLDRSSRPNRGPRRLAAELEQVICERVGETGGPGDESRSPAGLAPTLCGRCSAASASPASTRAGQSLRMALPWRPGAHGRLPLRALPASGASSYERPLADGCRGRAPRRLRLPARGSN